MQAKAATEAVAPKCLGMETLMTVDKQWFTSSPFLRPVDIIHLERHRLPQISDRLIERANKQRPETVSENGETLWLP